MKSAYPFLKFILFRTLCCFIVLATILSCEKEDFREDPNPEKLSEFTIETHQSINYKFDDRMLEKLNDIKSQMFTRQKSFYDSINHFYIDDSRFNLLKSGTYESYSFAIVDTKDTVYNKQLIVATKLNAHSKIYYETYLAKIPKISVPENAQAGDLISNDVQITKFETAFSINKELAYISAGDCLSVYSVSETNACGDPIDFSSHCGTREVNPDGSSIWVPRRIKVYTLISRSCSTGGGGTSSGSGSTSGGDGSSSGDGSSGTGGSSFDPDGSTPFSPVESCPLSTAKSTGLTDDNGCDFDVDKHNEEQAMLKEFYNFLDADLTIWLNYLHNKDFKVTIEDYLKFNMGLKSLHSFAFAKEAIKAKKEDGRNEVDFADQIINRLTGKSKIVYDKLKGSSLGFKNMIKRFDGEFPVSHLLYENSSELPNNVNARTSPPMDFIIKIRINTNNLDRPELSIARTFIHETIHAEMFRKLLSLASNNGQINVLELRNNLQTDNFPGILDYYTRFGVNGFQHQQMAAHYRASMIESLKEFDSNFSENIYEALSWVGLIGTESWNALSNTEQTNILQTVINFDNS